MKSFLVIKYFALLHQIFFLSNSPTDEAGWKIWGRKRCFDYRQITVRIIRTVINLTKSTVLCRQILSVVFFRLPNGMHVAIYVPWSDSFHLSHTLVLHHNALIKVATSAPSIQDRNEEKGVIKDQLQIYKSDNHTKQISQSRMSLTTPFSHINYCLQPPH